MILKFYKYQGTGNDFIIIDNRELFFEKNNTDIIKKLCDRKFGIGSDGIILIENNKDVDFNMVFINPDGSQSFCGNGSRCAVKFAYDFGIINNNYTKFISTDGIHEANITKNNNIKLKMSDVHNIDINTKDNFYFMNTGSPHYIKFYDNIDDINIIEKGREIRYSKNYKAINGTNVNFVESNDNLFKIRTYERGVENETLSCGTGVTACALAISLENKTQENKVIVQTKGGKLKVYFNKNNNNFNNIWLEGSAKQVFEGKIKI